MTSHEMSQQGEQKEKRKEMPEGSFEMKTTKGAAVVERKGEELTVVMTEPLDAKVLGIKKEGDGLEIQLPAFSTDLKSSLFPMKLRLSASELGKLFGAARKEGVILNEQPLPEKPGKWDKGGKMDKMLSFALKVAESLGKGDKGHS